jgi:hypothetical protein
VSCPVWPFFLSDQPSGHVVIGCAQRLLAAGQEDPDGKGGPGGYDAGQARYIEPQCLDVTADGRIIHYECHGNYNQRWVVDEGEATSKGFMLRSQDAAFDGKCLTAADDGSLSMQDCEDLNSPWQVWYVPELLKQ